MGPIVCQSVVSNDSNLEAHLMAIRPHETAQFQLCIMVFVFDGTFLFTEEFRSVMFFVSHMIVPSCRCLSAGLSHLSLFSSSFCKFVDSFHLRFVNVNRRTENRGDGFLRCKMRHSVAPRFHSYLMQALHKVSESCECGTQPCPRTGGWVNQEKKRKAKRLKRTKSAENEDRKERIPSVNG